MLFMFKRFIDNDISFVDLQRVGDTDVESGLVELSWEAVVKLMSTHIYSAQKDRRCFIPGKFKPRGEWVMAMSDKETFRNDANVEAITMIVLDLDEEGAREKAEVLYSEYEYIIYSTHSYTKDTPYKFRMILRLEAPIPVSEWPSCFNAMIYPIDGDKSCGRSSSVFYFPAHNPKAGIRPFFYHHEGRMVSANDISRFKEKSEQKYGDDLVSGVKSYTKPVEKAHFSGSKVDFVRGSIDYTYEGMKERFKHNLKNLSDTNQRHNFAMRVIGREISIMKNEVNLFMLVQFIFRASTEYGDRPLTHPASDTAKEIPELISSAIYKFAPDLVSGESPAYKDLRGQVRSIVSKVFEMALLNKWSFEEKPRIENPVESARAALELSSTNKTLDSLSGWITRNRKHMGSIVHENMDEISFSKLVYDSEMEVAEGKLNINLFGQFVFYCYDGLYSKVKMLDPVAKSSALNDLCERLVTSVGSIACEEDKQRFLTASFKIAHKCSENCSWKFKDWDVNDKRLVR